MYPSRESLAPAPSIPLADAANHVSPDQRITIARLMQKIPLEVQGIFGVIITDGQVTGLEMLPNPATAVMNDLAVYTGQDPRESAVHGRGQTKRWEGEEFQALVQGISHFNAAKNTAQLMKYSRTKPDRAAEQAHDHGLTYRYSTTLSQLLCHPVLSRAEQQRLRNASAAIPANLRGVFCCDVASDAAGNLVVSALGIDPNQITNRTALELMEPFLTPPSTFLREEAQRAGIRPHNYAFMLPRDAYIALADNPPAAVRQRG